MVDNEEVNKNLVDRAPRTVSATVKRPEDYQLGDDIEEFFPKRKIYLPSFPVEHAALVDELEAAKKQSHEGYAAYLDSYAQLTKARADVILALGKLKHAATYAQHFRPSSEKTGMDEKPQSAASSPSGIQTEPRRNRLEGVDISELPAGFGKRRASATGGQPKKSKTPPEAAPELEPGSRTTSPPLN
jgi:hypothetical protein